MSDATLYSPPIDAKITDIVEKIQGAAKLNADTIPWIVTETKQRDTHVLLKIVCTFKFPLKTPER